MIKKRTEFANYYNKFKSNPRWFIRLIVSRVLLLTRLCKLFTIEFDEIKLRFHPTQYSADLWFPKKNIIEDYNLPFLNTGDSVVDIGANIGFTTLLFKKYIGDEGKVYAFEPNPQIFEYLKKNIALNNSRNIYLFNSAVGEKKDKVYLQDNKNLDTGNRITQNRNNSFWVNMDVLDSLLPKILSEEVQLLKVDTEGYEKFVFLGATKILSKTNVIIFEAIEENCRQFNYSMSDVIEILSKLGFHIYCYNKNSKEFENLNFEMFTTNSKNYLYDLFATKDPSMLNGLRWI
jgi:FkbM family methyltransferase